MRWSEYLAGIKLAIHGNGWIALCFQHHPVCHLYADDLKPMDMDSLSASIESRTGRQVEVIHSSSYISCLAEELKVPQGQIALFDISPSKVVLSPQVDNNSIIELAAHKWKGFVLETSRFPTPKPLPIAPNVRDFLWNELPAVPSLWTPPAPISPKENEWHIATEDTVFALQEKLDEANKTIKELQQELELVKERNKRHNQQIHETTKLNTNLEIQLLNLQKVHADTINELIKLKSKQ